jgi:hypothetical protein
VDLSQGEVDDFMAAQKVVPSSSPIQWDERGPSQTLWQGAVEVEAVQLGLVTLYINPQFERRWNFKLSLHKNDVYRIDVKPPPVGHSNPTDRPDGCPGKVNCPVHEHRWHEGLDLRCAYPLENLSGEGYERILEEFCERARIDFRPQYIPPAKGFQLEIGKEL